MADDNDPEIVFRRARKHAKAQAKSDAARKRRKAPRRDDLARCAYYVLLLMLREAEARGDTDAADRIRRLMSRIVKDALFDPKASMSIFNEHAGTVVRDLEGGGAMRRIAQQKLLEEEAARSAAE